MKHLSRCIHPLILQLRGFSRKEHILSHPARGAVNAITGGGFIAPMAVEALPEEKRPAACIGCRSCEAVCPQQLKISEALADFARKLG